MSIKPHGDRVLVELLPDEQPKDSRIVIAATANKEAVQPLERGVIRGVGGKCSIPVQIGDEVMVFTNHGMALPSSELKLYFSQHVVLKKEANA